MDYFCSGGLEVGVPAELRGLKKAHSIYGKLKWFQLIQPSIHLAQKETNIGKHMFRFMNFSLTNQAIQNDTGLRLVMVIFTDWYNFYFLVLENNKTTSLSQMSQKTLTNLFHCFIHHNFMMTTSNIWKSLISVITFRNYILCVVLANHRLGEDVLKTSWRFLSSWSSEDVFKTPSRGLDQVKSWMVIRLQKTSSRLLEDVLIKTRIFVLVIHLNDVFKTSSTYCINVLKTSTVHLQDVFTASSRRLAKMCWIHLQNVFKTSLRCMITLNCSC